MTTKLGTIGFDADDTLWHNERFFALSQAAFADLLKDYAAPEHLEARLLEAERRNIGHYGYGIKGFVLSMIETAIAVTDGRVPGAVIAQLLAIGQEMLRHPIDLLPHVQTTVETLAQSHALVLITKGDLIDQERKLAQSGLGELFQRVEIVSDKTPAVYARIFATTPGGPDRALMIGNSMRSDILPALAAGAHAAHVPYDLLWPLEQADKPRDHPRFHEIESLAQAPDLVARLGI